MKSKIVKFFCSTAVSSALMFGIMINTTSCTEDEDCPNLAINVGKFSETQCETKCKEHQQNYQNHFIEDGNCCCWN